MRVYNFSAGPAVLPEEVLREAQADLLEYKDSGMSVMEMSHRSKDFEDILFTAEKDLRQSVIFAGRSLHAVCDDTDELNEK